MPTRNWSTADFVPFSFTIDGVSSRRVLKNWMHAAESATARMTISTWREPRTGLTVTSERTEYLEHAVTAWRMTITAGTAPSGRIADLRAIDASVLLTPGPVVIRTAYGSHHSVWDFAPLVLPLPPGDFRLFTTEGGRSTDGGWDERAPIGEPPRKIIRNGWPYFNIDAGTEGVIVAVGWPGQWGAEFVNENGSITVAAAMCQRDDAGGNPHLTDLDLADLHLHPGESISTPLIVLQRWSGDWRDGQNLWRTWMSQCVIPDVVDGQASSVCSFEAANGYRRFQSNETLELDWLRQYIEAGTPRCAGGFHTHYWLDAGWYPNEGDWRNVGTWQPDPERFPHGLKPLRDVAAAAGLKMILWAEPERAMPGTWLAENRPGWLLSAPPRPNQQGWRDRSLLVNFGIPEVVDWFVDCYGSLFSEAGVDGFYRDDFNVSPLPYWVHADEPDRRGVTQIRYIEGHLAFWSRMRARLGGIGIDNSASGGRRLDLMSLGLSVPLSRSDMVRSAEGCQGHTYGISLWLPFTGTQKSSAYPISDAYATRSSMAPAWHVTLNLDDELDWGSLHRFAQEWLAVNDGMQEIFHPLTDYSLANDTWLAWQHGRRDQTAGWITAFRRSECPDAHLVVHPRGLKPSERYRFSTMEGCDLGTDWGSGASVRGVVLTAHHPRTALLVRYEMLTPDGLPNREQEEHRRYQ